MFHVIFSLTSRFLYLRNILQGFARGILTLRSLDTISSHLTPALSPPPPVPLLDAPDPFVERLEQIISPYPSRDVIAIERQFPVSASPFPIYQSSLIAVTPSHFPNFLPVLVILAVISGFVVILPEITYFFTNIAKSFKSMFYCPPTGLPSQFVSSKLPISLVSLLLLWSGPPAIATFFTFVWFASILFSYDQVSDMIVAILQWCGLLIVQDTRTPPLLDAVYEQITRGAAGYSDNDLSDEHNIYEVITDYSLGYSHLAAQLSAHEVDLQNAPMPIENQGLEVSVQRIPTESADSQNLNRQLELLRAREQKLDADLLASQQERERLIELVSTLENSRRDQQRWREIAAFAKELYTEAEMTASNLRADLAAATDRARNVQEQLDHQIELASGKDSIIQSITKESRLAQTKLRIERDRRLRETKELFHEKVMNRNRYESEIRRLTQEAQDAKEQLDALRDTLSQLRSDRQPPLDCDHPLHYQPPTTWPFDTGRPPLPPERNLLDTGTPPVSSTIDADSSHQSTKWSPRSPIQDPMDSSARLASLLLVTPGFIDQESEAAKEQRAKLTELIERMRQVEPESTANVKPKEQDEAARLQEVIATKEQLRLAEEDVRDLRRELGQSRESLREVETRVRALEHVLDNCRETVREAQDAQRASEVKFTEATQLLRVHQAESESSMARAEESQFKCSQATLLCAALQERVTELEAKVKKLKSARKYRAHSNSPSPRRPTGSTCKDLEAVAHDPGIRDSDSIYMTVPASIPCLLDLPLPPSSPSNDSSLYFDHQECSTVPLASADSGSCCPTDIDPEEYTHDTTNAQTFDSIFLTVSPSLPSLPCLRDLSLPSSSSQSSSSHQMRPEIAPTCTDSHSLSPEDINLDITTPDSNSQILDSSLSPQASTNLSPSQSEDFSLPSFIRPGSFLSERNGLGSVDWPPIGSSLLPEHGNAQQDDNINLRSPTEENGDDPIFLCQKAILSPIKEMDEPEVLERHTSLDRDSGFSSAEVAKTVTDPTFSGRVVSDDDHRFWGLSQRGCTPDAPPIWTLPSPRSPAVPTRKRQVDIPVTLEREEVTHLSLASLSEPPLHLASSSRIDLPLPVLSQIILPRFSLSPSGIRKVLERRFASSETKNGRSNAEVGSAAPDPPLDGFPGSVQNGKFHSTEASSLPGRRTASMSPTECHFSHRSQDNCREAPAYHERERLNTLSAGTARPAGVMSSWTSPNTFSPPGHPPSVSLALDCQDVQRSSESSSVLPLDAQPSRTTLLDSLPLSIPAHLDSEDRGRPMVVLGSGHKGIAGTSSSRTALRSLPSRSRPSADQRTSMRVRRHRRDSVPQSSIISSARSDLAPEAFFSSSDDLPITTSRTSGRPLSQISNLPEVSLARKDVKMQAVNRIPKSIPRPPPSRLAPEPLDQACIRSDEADLDEDDSPCASGKAQNGKGRRPKDYRISSRSRDTSSPDRFLPRDAVSSFGRATLKGPDHDFEDFVFFIPPDCPTSTPVASRKRASGKCWAGSDSAALADVDPSLVTTRVIEAMRHNATWMF